MKRRLSGLAAALFLSGIPGFQGGANAAIRYVAIGDSYSIGEGARLAESWPALLANRLRSAGIPIHLIANPSRTGWTTQQAIDRELPVLEEAGANFVTLQVGVNDWVQGVDATTFRKRFRFLVDEILKRVGDPRRLLVINVPDFSVTPNGPRYGRGRDISDGIASFNRIISDESDRRGLQVVDVFELSKGMRKDKGLVASDGLHPSAQEYAEWEKRIFPVALGLLSRDER